MKKWEQFTDEQIQSFINNSRSVRELATKLGYASDGGGSIANVKAMLKQKQFDTSHFLGQSWHKDDFDYTRFQYGKVINISDALNAIVAIRGRKCECCQNTLWNNMPIPLEVHHLDGNHLNNQLENLQILCPNCHALTSNYKKKNKDKIKSSEISDEQFIKALENTPNVRQALLQLGLSAAGGNYARAYDLINKYNIIQIK